MENVYPIGQKLNWWEELKFLFSDKVLLNVTLKNFVCIFQCYYIHILKQFLIYFCIILSP